jgi:hypothetical protein
MGVAGWMGIAWRHEKLYRLYALLYGLGAGLLGDEIGLLLTFGNYQSELTYMFFVATISAVIIGTLLIRYWDQLQRDLGRLSTRERWVLVTIYVVSFSFYVIFLSSGISLIAIPISLGILGLLVLFYTERKRMVGELRPRK